MSLSLTALEAKRSSILQQFVGLGDLRPGSISAVAAVAGSRTAIAPNPTILATIRNFAWSAK
jgi:hypothetical protein